MPRGSLAGTTDYSHQTLADITSDLDEWLSSLSFVQNFLEAHLEKLNESGYWDSVIDELKSVFAYSMKFYDTCLQEIGDIRREVQIEVQQHHVTRLNRLYQTAHELNLEFGRVWHREFTRKDYGTENFRVLEWMYGRGRDMAVDLLDLSNASARLQDFVGKKGSAKTQAPTRIEHPDIHPNIVILTQRMDTALTREDYAEVLHASASIFETLAKDIVGIPNVQSQTLKSFFERYRKDSALPNGILDYILAIYESRSTTPLAGHGSTQAPDISPAAAIVLSEMTKAFVSIEYKLRENPL